jgi:hypothetical protein
MNELLQLLGSVASLLSIPLAIYLFLRSREAQLRRVREEIVRSLSYQIGDGRALSQFEIQAVIDSHARVNRIRKGKILSDEIVEDLVADTIRNPMIASSRKQEVIDDLHKVHNRHLFGSRLKQLEAALAPEDLGIIVAQQQRLINSDFDAFFDVFRLSNVFMITFVIIGFVLSGIIYFYSPAFWAETNTWELKKQAVLWLVLGAISSIVAGLVTIIYRWLIQRTKRRTKSIGEHHRDQTMPTED